MAVIGSTCLISLVKGRTDLLRVPEKFCHNLTIQESISAIAILPNGHKLPILLNPKDRTLIGLRPWLDTIDISEVRGINITVKGTNPYLFMMNLSNESVAPVDKVGGKVVPPNEGLYIGGKLLPQFYELIKTKEAVKIEEANLLQHVFICGTTGSGKTVLAKVFIEEAALKGIPVIAIDLKGDISSMAFLLSGEDPYELLPWISTMSCEDLETEAARIAQRHKSNLNKWGMDDKNVGNFKKKVSVNVFTPRSNAGFRLALSAFVEPPKDLDSLRERDPDSYEDVIQFMAETFVSRLNLTRKYTDKARGYVYEIIKHFWEQGVSLRGYDGILRVLEEVRHGQDNIEQIGGLMTSEFISEKDRSNISDAINTLLIGAQKLWFEGFPLEVEALINPKYYDGKNPVTIINVKHLGFQDQAYVVGYIAYQIWFWMRRLEGLDKPRLIFYIDEIGGGGSKEAFFPSVASSPSKPALNLLLRQGRGYGVCCMYATQSPGDIDYKALGQCGTWAVGQLRTKRERQKIEQGSNIAEIDFDACSKHLPTLNTGQFIIRTPTKPWTVFEERWLMHLHRVLSQRDVERLKEQYEKEVSCLYEEAQKLIIAKEHHRAQRILESIIGGYRFSSICSKAYLLLGLVLFDVSEYDHAIQVLDEMIHNRMEAEETGDAYFLLGKCKEQKSLFSEAAMDFGRVSLSAASDETKTKAHNHEEYCKCRTMWKELPPFQKLCLWILGRKPDESALLQLTIADREIMDKKYTTVFHPDDIMFPDSFDTNKLYEKIKIVAQEEVEKTREQILTKKWSIEQIPRIHEMLNYNNLEAAEELCQKIVTRLVDTHVAAPASVLSALNECSSKIAEKETAFNNKILQIEARQFEFEIAHLFQKKGYRSFVTQSTGDGGVDVWASNAVEKVIIQCKRWKNVVGRNVVDELAGVKLRNDVDRAILATTSSFSEGAVLAAEKNEIELWDFDKIRQEWRIIFSQ